MGRIRIIADDRIPFLKGALDDRAEVVYLPGKAITAGAVRDADALIIRTRTRCDRALLEGSTVKMIATATIGYDHIDTEYCDSKGIRWTNAPGCNASSVEQYMVSLLVELIHQDGLRPADLTLGIVGAGNVGSKVARAAAALGFRILVNDPPRERAEGQAGFVSLDELLENAQIISLHVPLNASGQDRTLGMADEAFFGRIRPGAVFINTSRGEVVDETALKMAAGNGRIGSVCLDVFENEPRVDPGLLKLARIATPHIAGYSTDGKANGTRMSVSAVSNFFSLGLDNWQPEDLPLPEEEEIYADAGSEELLSLVAGVYAHTYDIMRDHAALVADPSRFEQLRGDYRIRREPQAYRVRLFNDDGVAGSVLGTLGFGITGDSCY